MDEIKKKVDQDWKETVTKEKAQSGNDGAFVPPDPDFGFFVTSLAVQAAIALGAVPNPLTNKKEEDLAQAKFLIDTLGMIKEKTKGNLNNDESGVLENILYELRMQYLEKAKK